MKGSFFHLFKVYSNGRISFKWKERYGNQYTEVEPKKSEAPIQYSLPKKSVSTQENLVLPQNAKTLT